MKRKLTMMAATVMVFSIAAAAQAAAIPTGGLLWWLEADQGVTQTDGGTVSAWADQSGNARNATAPTGHFPFYNASNRGINGKPSLHWAAGDTVTATSGQTMTASVPVNGLSDMTIIAVAADAEPNFTTGNEGPYMNERTLLHWTQVGGASGQVGFGVFQQFVCWRFGTGTNGATGEWTRTADPTFKTTTVIRSLTIDGKETLYVNGVQKLQVTATATTIGNTSDTVKIGLAGQNAEHYWSGDVAEIIVYNRALTLTERQQVESYLAVKYYPSAATPPIIVSAQTATPTSLSQVQLIFSKPLTTTSATTLANYTLDHGATFSAASLSADGVIVTLTTSAPLLHSTSYTVTVSGVQDTDGNTILPNSTAGFATGAAILPTIASAAGTGTTSITTVTVTFSKPVTSATASNPANYALDHGATVNSVSIVTSTSVLLTTSTLTHSTTYTLTGNNLLDFDTPPNAMLNSTASFITPALVLPTITSATSTGTTNISAVTVVFSKPVTVATASNPANYALNHGATILAVTNVTTTSVTLTTSTLTHSTTYTLTGNNLLDFDTPPNAMLNATASFITPAAVLPAISTVTAVDTTHVRVVFSKPVSVASASTLANYTLTGGILVSGASLAADNVTVTLTTSALTKETAYTLSISNVQDLDVPPNAILPGSNMSFVLLDVPVAGLYWWLKADASVTLNGGNVQTWGDRSVNNWPASQANAALQPAYVASNSAVNGKPTIHFNGTSAFLSTSGTAVPLTGKTNLTIFAVASSADATTNVADGGYGYGQQHTMVHFIQSAAWGQGIFSVYEQGVNVWYAAGTAHPNTKWSRPATTAWMIYDSTRDQTGAGVETLRVNGVSVATNPSGTAAIWAEDGGVNVGAWDGNSVWAGDIAEFIIYTRALSDAERQAVEQYLQAKYFTLLPQPTVAITTPTSTYTAAIGSTVNFTAAVTLTNTAATLSGVTFYDGATAIGTAISAGGNNYTFAWNTTGKPLGLHNVTAVVADSAGGQGTSSPATVINLSNAAPPAVTIRTPTDGIIVGQGYLVRLTATTTAGTSGSVTGVEFFDGITNLGHGGLSAANTYTYTWDTSDASYVAHTIRARVTDSGGVTASSGVLSIRVRIPGDANGDNIVDGLDYGFWQSGYLQPGASFGTGDYNSDGVVDGLDYGVWQNNYLRTAGLSDGVAASAAEAASTPMSGASAPRLVAVTPTAGAVALVFDSDVVVGDGAVEVSGLASGPQAYTAAYDAATRTLTLTFATALPADTYTVRVIGSFVVAADGGAALDGAASGTAGSDAQVQFSAE